MISKSDGKHVIITQEEVFVKAVLYSSGASSNPGACRSDHRARAPSEVTLVLMLDISRIEAPGAA